MPIERYFLRPMPVPTEDAIKVAQQIMAGDYQSAVIRREILTEGVHPITRSAMMVEELEAMEDGTCVFRHVPTKEVIKRPNVSDHLLRAISYHIPHDRRLIVFRGVDPTDRGNMIGFIVYRDRLAA